MGVTVPPLACRIRFNPLADRAVNRSQVEAITTCRV